MKPSEIRLLEMINRNNHMRIADTRVSFGGPRVAPGQRYNTIIPVYATPGDKQYNRSTAVRYNRLDSRLLGKNSVIDIKAHDLSLAVGALLAVLDKVYNIPCSVEELIPRSSVSLSEALALLVFDFDNHPLVFGTITVRVQLGVGNLETILTTTALSGFLPEDIANNSVSDLIPIVDLSGFTLTDVIPHVEDYIFNTQLSGFTLEEVTDKLITDEITIRHLPGFVPDDVR